LDLTSEEVVALCDFRFVEDVLTPEAAVQMLEEARADRATRAADVLVAGYPGYDTSFGWLQFSDEELVANAKTVVAAGFKTVKLKVGSPDSQRDIRRAKLVREVLGPDVTLLLDVNQQWTLAQTLVRWEQLKVGLGSGC
jgi:L-fuconate dehydratase